MVVLERAVLCARCNRLASEIRKELHKFLPSNGLLMIRDWSMVDESKRLSHQVNV